MEFALCDAQIDEFPSGPFDAVLSQFGIMFFDDPVAALTNIRRHLTQGGRSAFIVWQPEDSMAWSPAHVVVTYLPPPEEGAADTIERAGSWGDPSFAKDVMTSAGFVDVRVEERNVDVEGYCQVGESRPNIVGLKDAPSTISWGRIGLRPRLVKILERPAGQQFAPSQRPLESAIAVGYVFQFTGSSRDEGPVPVGETGEAAPKHDKRSARF